MALRHWQYDPYGRRHGAYPPGSMWDDPWHDGFFEFPTPSRIFGQHFGIGLTEDDLLPPVMWRGAHVRPRANRQLLQQTGMSQVTNDEKEFRAMVDVAHFKPEEINVKTKDNKVIISAKHEEQQDEHGFIKREFTRQYVLPKDVDPNTVTSSLSHDGILTVKAPKLALEAPKERSIPIQHHGNQAVMDTK
ncbi:hypothetical protein FSP39_014981 [Pinctada imbricata]|uniref:SHSP domain-containing protein n=1 Tax=Pinctada imbricata TaxID=66713 RepID=A0AA88YKA1_PINIB|nr:hypothetical protein FSP39_014981 [Pinctada imbricata]